MIKGRKADTTLWGILVRVLLVMAVIVLVFMFADKIWAAIKPLSYDDYAKQQFDILAQDVEDLLENGKPFSTSTSLYSFHKDFTVVGFDHDWMQKISTKAHSTKDKEGPVVKPDACYEEREGQKMERACLCLYKGDIRELEKPDTQALLQASNHPNRNKNVVKCKNYRGKVVFLGKLHDESLENREGYVEDHKGETRLAFPDADHPNYEYLFLYSEKDNAFWDLYLEKYRKDGITYIYITKNFPEYIHMFDFFHTCPEGSDKACVGKHFDETISVTEAVADDSELPAYLDDAMHFVCHYYEEDGVCKYKMYGDCKLEIYEACMCGEQIRFSGMCIDNKYYPQFDLCGKVSRCEDYCPGQSTTVGCLPEEAELCELDPCHKNCMKKVQTSYTLGDKTTCVEKAES